MSGKIDRRRLLGTGAAGFGGLLLNTVARSRAKAQSNAKGSTGPSGPPVRERALVHGRNPGNILLVPGLVVVLGETREEAYRKHEALHGADGEEGLVRDFFKRAAIPDLSGLDPDKPIDPALFTYTQDQLRPVGFTRSFAELTASEELTPRQLVRLVDGGHRLAVGTPQEVAATILDWWGTGAVDGFNIHIPVLPEGIAEFNRTVIPLLQASGAFPTEYDGLTIRQRLGLPDPVPAVGISEERRPTAG